MLTEGQAVHLLKTTGSYTGVCMPNLRSARKEGAWVEEPGGFHLFYLLCALQNSCRSRAGWESQAPSWQMDRKAPCQMIWMNLAEPRAGKRDCPSGSDFSPEGSGTLL